MPGGPFGHMEGPLGLEGPLGTKKLSSPLKTRRGASVPESTSSSLQMGIPPDYNVGETKPILFKSWSLAFSAGPFGPGGLGTKKEGTRN